MIAAIGPWSAGYGLRPDNMDIVVIVSSGANGISFSRCPTAPSSASLVVIEEIQEETLQNALPNPLNNDLPLAITGTTTSSPEDHHVRMASDPLGLAAVNAITMPSGHVITRGHRTRPPPPISTTEVRRNNRSNKYNGFRT